MLLEALKKREMAYQDAGGLGASQQGAGTLGWRDHFKSDFQPWGRVRCLSQRGSPLWLRWGQDEGRQAEFKAFGP